jgi:predicted dehydrogenase
MKKYRAAVIGCSRMGGFIDNEVIGLPGLVLPYSHAAGFYACDRVDLVACSDVRPDVMEQFGQRYDIPKERQYTDYREMIERENLDIISVATQPEPRAEIVIYAVDRGVKAIYAEKALTASLAEADAMVEALERNGAILNMGTNRRWSPVYDQVTELIAKGEIGTLKSIIIYNNGTLFNTGSHTLDVAMRLNGDAPAVWVQGRLPDDNGSLIEGDLLHEDPRGEGIIGFANGVTLYALMTPRQVEFEAIGDEGVISILNDGRELQMRRRMPKDGRNELQFVDITPAGPVSTTLRLIEDLVHSLDTGEPPVGGARVALANTELIFGIIESHRRGGARVELPLDVRNLRMQRKRGPNQPKYQA